MPYPSLGTERARPDIAETFLEMDLELNMQNMVASRVLPVRDVELAHGTYPAITLKTLLGKPASQSIPGTGKEFVRAVKGGYVRDELVFVERSYSTTEHGLEGPVDEREAIHYASQMDHESTVALWIRHRLLQAMERRVASECFSTTRFAGQTAAATALWSAADTADPIGDVLAARLDVVNTYGIWPDTAVMNRVAWNYLKETDQIRNRVHSQGAGQQATAATINEQIVAGILDLDEIIVAGAVEDTASPSAAFAGDHIWQDDCLVFKKVRGTSVRSIGLGHIFHWAADGSQPNGMAEDYREPQVRSNIMRIRHQVAEIYKLNVGFLITNVY